MFQNTVEPKGNAEITDARNTMRSRQGKEFVRIDANIGEIRAIMPVGRGWNRDGSDLEWINLGWTPADEYAAKKNSEQAAAKRDALKVADAQDTPVKGKKNG